MKQGPIISTQILFNSIFSANFSGNLPYFYLIVLHVEKCDN